MDELSYGRANPADNPRMVGVFREIRQNLTNYTLRDVLEPFRKEQLKETQIVDSEE